MKKNVYLPTRGVGYLIVLIVLLSGLAASCPKKADAPNTINALREAYEPLPKVYDSLLESNVITVQQYNEVIVPADKALYLGIQGAWIYVDQTGDNNVDVYKEQIRKGLDLLDTIQNEKLQAATSAVRLLLEVL